MQHIIDELKTEYAKVGQELEAAMENEKETVWNAIKSETYTFNTLWPKTVSDAKHKLQRLYSIIQSLEEYVKENK